VDVESFALFRACLKPLARLTIKTIASSARGSDIVPAGHCLKVLEEMRASSKPHLGEKERSARLRREGIAVAE